jgi:hypothetical protein
MVRKPKGRKTARLNKTKKKDLRDLAPEILRWTRDSLKVLMQNREPEFPAEVENDRDEDLWCPLLAIADTLGGKVPALARRAMLELIAVDHEQSVGEELMTAICTLMEEELVVHPKVHQIALPRLVGLVNGVEGSWSEYRGGLGCDGRWLGAQLRSFSLPRTKSVRDPAYNESVAKGYDIHELLKVSRRYRAGAAEDETNREQAPPETASTPSTPSTGTANALEKRSKNDGKNVDADVDVDDARKTARINPITGKVRGRPSVLHAASTSTSASTKSASENSEKPPENSATYGKSKAGVDAVDDVDAVSGGDHAASFSDPIPGVDDRLPIDLTKIDPADLLPGEMKYYGYSVGPAPTFRVILPPGMVDDNAAAYAQACRLANDHRMAAWRRFLAKRGN